MAKGDRKGSGRFSIVDPNDFGYQYNDSIFGDTNYNMSVPPEELCIIVELLTTQKARSVLINTQNGTQKKNSEGSSIVNFIKGKKDGSTGYGNFLTTSYTDLGTENIIEEALGITNIQIEFNSSYAPMVNIDFIDVRGGAIFQSGAKSIYNVLFRLPYPLFELKIKGFYGKPVVYCLHMVKCNTKFNSQTGNFEISASFVGYTYAMFADMILGYLRAAVRTPDGIDLLKSKDTISINQFMKDMNNIDKLVEEQLANTSNVNRNNVALINELQGDLTVIEGLVDSYIGDLKNPTICEAILGDTTEPYQTSIVFFPDPRKEGETSFGDAYKNTNVYKIGKTFREEYKKKRDAYNTKVGNLLSAKLIETNQITGGAIAKVNELIGPTGGVNNADMIDNIKESYEDLIDGTNNEVISGIVKRFQNALPKTVSPSEAYIIVRDVTETRQYIQDARTELEKAQKDFTDSLALDIADAIESKLTFEPNIRNIFKMFTAHIEIFLELMFKVSSRYLETTRIDELKKFKSQSLDNQRLDIKKTDDAVIYPWPEYIENDVERYLGSAGVLENPLLVPEVKFVEDLYVQMVKNIQEDEAVQLNSNGVVAWQAFSPIDSIRSIPDKTPYDRLPDSANQDDIARLIVLRAAGVLGWQPSNLIDDKEIESFAKAEAELIIQKYKTNKIILPALTSNYNTVDKYSAVKGIVNGTEKNLLSASTYNNIEHWDYKYIEIPFKGSTPFNRYEIPADKGFNSITNPYYGNYSDFKLSNRSGSVKYDDNAESADTAKYISIIGADDYDSITTQPPLARGPSIFKYDLLSNDLTSPVDADFFLSNGKYGVQEYSSVDYSSKSEYGAGQLGYHSIFYDNPLIENGWEGIQNGLSTRRINSETPLDLTFSGGAFAAYTFENITTSEYIDTFIPGERYNVLSNNHESVGKNITLFSNETTQDQVSFPFFNFAAQTRKYSFNFSLFGSRLYNAQTSVYPKAFLFLHCFPWKGLVGKSSRSTGILSITDDVGIFKQKEIFNTFAIRNGFVKVPKLWPAFIGSLIWRYREGLAGKIPVTFKIGNESLIPGFSTNDDDYPKNDEYLKAYPEVISFETSKTNLNIFGLQVATGNDALNDNQSNFSMFFCDRLGMSYEKIDPEILALPPKVQDLFVSEFDTFVKEEFTNDIIPLLDITKGDGTAFFGDSQWKAQWDILRSSTVVKTDAKSLEEYDVNGTYTEITVNTLAKMNELYGNKLNIGKLEDNYSVMTYIYALPTLGKFDYNLFIEYKLNGPAEKKLKELLFSHKYIENNSVFIWSNGIKDTNPTPKFLKSKFAKYIDTINQALIAKVTDDQKTIVSPGENEKIKLEIYRTCKKIYDKWIAGVGGSPRPFNDILFQCCSKGTNEPYRLAGDTAINTEYGKGTPAGLNLIDSFRFVSRSFEDISKQFQIHPVMVTHQLYESPDSSIYDLFGRILTDNNFEFIALPNFINFNDPKELHSIFEPYPYYMAQKETATGPSFVCVYVGQTSTKLDFGPDSEYPNDGFDITNDKTWPKDFSEEKASWEDFASAFIVKYGQQNQNIFKDIRLDQSEFNETAESLAITDAISNSLSSANQSYVGQNLYNVYSVRSYKAEVEMLGDAMIQPMMYFQLDNIPMFHGAYLITKVTHSIVPNNMTTVFTGTRIRIAKTPLIDKATLYSSLISGQKIGAATAGSTVTYTPTQLLAPIAATIFRNDGKNAYLTQTNNQITMKKVVAPNGVGNQKAGTQVEAPAPDNENELNESLITEAANALEKMLTDFVTHAKQNNYKTFSDGNYITITSLYRNATKQTNLVRDNIKNKKPPGAVAAVGTSYHGWGLAVDLQTIDADGNALQISTSADNLKRGFDQNINISLKWFLENCWRYGFWMPTSLRDGSGVEEFWHFEYHGTSAICLWQTKEPKYVNNPKNTVTIPANAQYDPVVKNPKEPDGKEAVYSGCDFITVKGTANYELSTSDLLWIYFSWQQGPDGASQHYKVASGTQASYQSNVNTDFFTDNWPGTLVADNGVKKSDISTLYRSDPKKLANGFLNVWTKQLPIKAAEAQTRINGSAKDDLGRPYSRLKDIFKKYEQPNEGFSLDNIITMGMQENGLQTYTDPNSGYAGMFQMGKKYDVYKPYITRSFKGKSGYLNYDEYDADIMTEGFVKVGIDNFKLFKKISGYNPQALNSSTQPTSTNTPTTLKNILVGDSLLFCLENILITAGSSARRISPTQGDASLYFGGKDTTWLIGALKKYPVSTGVENVVVSIGTNDGFQNSNNLLKVLTELRRVFPSAKYLFVRGSGGWIGNIKYKPNGDINKIYGTKLNGTTTYDNTDVISYYSVLNGQPNVTVLNQGVGYSASDGEAHNCTGPYKLHYPVLANEIKSLIG